MAMKRLAAASAIVAIASMWVAEAQTPGEPKKEFCGAERVMRRLTAT